MFAAWAVGIDTDSLEGQEPPPMTFAVDVELLLVKQPPIFYL